MMRRTTVHARLSSSLNRTWLHQRDAAMLRWLATSGRAQTSRRFVTDLGTPKGAPDMNSGGMMQLVKLGPILGTVAIVGGIYLIYRQREQNRLEQQWLDLHSESRFAEEFDSGAIPDELKEALRVVEAAVKAKQAEGGTDEDREPTPLDILRDRADRVISNAIQVPQPAAPEGVAETLQKQKRKYESDLLKGSKSKDEAAEASLKTPATKPAINKEPATSQKSSSETTEAAPASAAADQPRDAPVQSNGEEKRLPRPAEATKDSAASSPTEQQQKPKADDEGKSTAEHHEFDEAIKTDASPVEGGQDAVKVDDKPAPVDKDITKVDDAGCKDETAAPAADDAPEPSAPAPSETESAQNSKPSDATVNSAAQAEHREFTDAIKLEPDFADTPSSENTPAAAAEGSTAAVPAAEKSQSTDKTAPAATVKDSERRDADTLPSSESQTSAKQHDDANDQSNSTSSTAIEAPSSNSTGEQLLASPKNPSRSETRQASAYPAPKLPVMAPASATLSDQLELQCSGDVQRCRQFASDLIAKLNILKRTDAADTKSKSDTEETQQTTEAADVPKTDNHAQVTASDSSASRVSEPVESNAKNEPATPKDVVDDNEPRNPAPTTDSTEQLAKVESTGDREAKSEERKPSSESA